MSGSDYGVPIVPQPGRSPLALRTRARLGTGGARRRLRLAAPEPPKPVRPVSTP